MSRVGLFSGIDVRGKGGFVVAPPSRYGENDYEWILGPLEVPLALAPAELVALVNGTREGGRGVQGEPRGAGASLEISARIPEGSRNAKLFRFGCSLRGRYGCDVPEIAQILESVNVRRCDPPLPAQEVEAIARSAGRYAAAPEWVDDPIGFSNDDRLDARSRLLLLVLCHVVKDDGTCWWSIRRLADVCAGDKNTLVRATKALEAARRVEVVRAGKRARGKAGANRYRLLPWNGNGTR